MNIRQATRAYEAWLAKRLKGDIVRKDLRKKHDRMRQGPFPFLRATYWRWAQTILEVCPDLAKAPSTLAIGDIHLENFGTWRDIEGRMVWGVNDFDEAAEMPYLIDLVRLAVSARLAVPGHMGRSDICANILRGYRKGISAPQPIVLDMRRAWLRQAFEASEADRSEFWRKMLSDAEESTGTPPGTFVKALNAARPSKEVSFEFWRRSAGTGSLGRPRWVGYGDWRSSPLVREAKAMVPSAWWLAHGGAKDLACVEIARGKHRAPDPWYALEGSILVRRLSPNNQKLELKKVGNTALLLNPRLLRLMGRDIAAAHVGTGNRQRAIARDLETRTTAALRKWSSAASAAVMADYKAWCGTS
jgi:hypothetical protein